MCADLRIVESKMRRVEFSGQVNRGVSAAGLTWAEKYALEFPLIDGWQPIPILGENGETIRKTFLNFVGGITGLGVNEFAGGADGAENL